MDFNQVIGNRIKEFLNEKELMSKELAALGGVPKSTLSEITSGKKTATILTMAKICHGLGITLAEFMDSSEINRAVSAQKMVVPRGKKSAKPGTEKTKARS